MSSGFSFVFSIFLFIFGTLRIVAEARRGPHHPRGCDTHDPKHSAADHLVHDKKHLEEDLQSLGMDHVDVDAMSEDERTFHYFKMHDSDGNDLLDGLEILRALMHTHRHHGDDEHDDNNVDEIADDDKLQETEVMDIDEYAALVDSVLEKHDSDNDGYLSYPEYMSSKHIPRSQ